eukprot:GHVN01107215.1.p2 GENE.GHVN01107215.1~~GHVN01107215.1.p2  ORF type:complete len:105 (+),score=1.22 GHVN01107215.1:100-414(+)
MNTVLVRTLLQTHRKLTAENVAMNQVRSFVQVSHKRMGYLEDYHLSGAAAVSMADPQRWWQYKITYLVMGVFYPIFCALTHNYHHFKCFYSPGTKLGQLTEDSW